MQVGTRHGARRTVPDFSGVKLDQAQRMARKYDLKLHINDSLFVPEMCIRDRFGSEPFCPFPIFAQIHRTNSGIAVTARETT